MWHTVSNEKCQKIQLGDEVAFTNRESISQIVTVRVVGMTVLSYYAKNRSHHRKVYYDWSVSKWYHRTPSKGWRLRRGSYDPGAHTVLRRRPPRSHLAHLWHAHCGRGVRFVVSLQLKSHANIPIRSRHNFHWIQTEFGFNVTDYL